MISAVHFQNFKALRSAALKLEPFNLVIGPNGSGKTSLIQALLRLRTLAALPAVHAHDLKGQQPAGPQIAFHFHPPYQNVRVTLGCNTDEMVCNLLVVDHPPGLEGEKAWGELRTRLQSIRAYLFDHYAIAAPSKRTDPAELTSNAGNLAAVLANWRGQHHAAFTALEGEFRRLVPEFRGLELTESATGQVEFGARLLDGNELVPADSMSQGVLYLLATLTLSLAPQPPAVVCLEEADRGVHPRTLREIRDALYRLSYPKDFALSRPATQVIATTHSPYLLDLFKNHPEEVVLAQKHGRAATFERLSDRTDLRELLQEAQLGDLWYSGVLGGVPGVE
ncbi:MAG TPA: AAA family ATPase [Candidatus Didemnitutus sp.]|nr:AAA family ATPase [Candidatus Didemnitutus sp.]